MTGRYPLLALAMLAGASLDAPAAPGVTPSAVNDTQQAPTSAAESKPRILNPMREKEPMSGEMKRDGMMKEDVRKQALKKDAMMRKAMSKEEMRK